MSFHRLVHAEARRRAVEAVQQAPEGYVATVRPPKRGLDINAALHASINEVVQARIKWAGQEWDIEGWKRLFVASWSRVAGVPIIVAPALDGQGVDIIYSPTSDMTQEQVRDLLAFIDAWKAEQPELQHRARENTDAQPAAGK